MQKIILSQQLTNYFLQPLGALWAMKPISGANAVIAIIQAIKRRQYHTRTPALSLQLLKATRRSIPLTAVHQLMNINDRHDPVACRVWAILPLHAFGLLHIFTAKDHLIPLSLVILSTATRNHASAAPFNWHEIKKKKNYIYILTSSWVSYL